MVRLVILLLLSCFAVAAQAAQHLDAYRIEVQVEDQSEAKRIAAAKSGLGDVIARVSGDAALQHPVVRQAIANAPDYLQQFSYSADRDKANSNAGIKITLNYSAQAIESLLRQAQLPLGDTAPKDAKTLIVRVDQVEDFTAFKQVRAYLESLTMIRRSELLSANKDVLMFRLTLEGDAALLTNTLAVDQRLLMAESPIADSQAPSLQAPSQALSDQLAFHWQD